MHFALQLTQTTKRDAVTRNIVISYNNRDLPDNLSTASQGPVQQSPSVTTEVDYKQGSDFIRHARKLCVGQVIVATAFFVFSFQVSKTDFHSLSFQVCIQQCGVLILGN